MCTAFVVHVGSLVAATLVAVSVGGFELASPHPVLVLGAELVALPPQFHCQLLNGTQIVLSPLTAALVEDGCHSRYIVASKCSDEFVHE